MNWVATRATLRIARRQAMRARGRSALVVAMIGLPVLAASAVGVLARSYQLDPDEHLQRRIGTADAAFTDTGHSRVEQAPRGDSFSMMATSDESPKQREPGEVAALLPPGTRAITDRAKQALVSRDDRTARGVVRELDYADPIARGIVWQVSGRAPRAQGEVAVSPRLAEALGAGAGDSIRLRGTSVELRVVGIARPYNGDEGLDVVLAFPGSALHALGGTMALDHNLPRVLADTPAPVRWADVRAYNAKGLVVVSRDVVFNPPPRSEVSEYARSSGVELAPAAVAAAVLAVGMTLLEVTLLAGPAFAVGARRSRRELAVVAAAGGERRHLRDIVLGTGLVLGAGGAALAALAGIGVAAIAIPIVEASTGGISGRFDVRPLELLGLVLIGALTGLAAAYLPARGAARQDVAAALTGRRGSIRAPRGLPVTGLFAFGGGVAIAALGVVEASTSLLLAGSVLAELGLVAMTGLLVSWAGRLGRFLPAIPRLALRDAARNRGRTAPAVAAVLAAVAGSAAIGTYVATQNRYESAHYVPTARHLHAVAGLPDDSVSPEQFEAAIARHLPVARTYRVREYGPPAESARETGGRLAHVSARLPKGQECPLSTRKVDDPREAARLMRTDPRCAGRERGFSSVGTARHVLDGKSLRDFTGADDPAAAAMLDRGGVVVFDRRYLDNGFVHLESATTDNSSRSYRLPAVAVEAEYKPAEFVMSPGAAKQLGFETRVAVIGAVLTRAPSEAEVAAANDALLNLATETYLHVERGYVGDYDIGMLALLAGATVVTVGASGIATGLAAADGRGDLATLAAVGAAPRTRRLLAAFQSAVTAWLGTVLGVVAGLVPAIALVKSLDRGFAGEFATQAPRVLVIPWGHLFATVALVPVLAALAAGLLTRSRLPLARRID